MTPDCCSPVLTFSELNARRCAKRTALLYLRIHRRGRAPPRLRATFTHNMSAPPLNKLVGDSFNRFFLRCLPVSIWRPNPPPTGSLRISTLFRPTLLASGQILRFVFWQPSLLPAPCTWIFLRAALLLVLGSYGGWDLHSGPRFSYLFLRWVSEKPLLPLFGRAALRSLNTDGTQRLRSLRHPLRMG